jgi:hypothetical protein
MHRIRYTSYRKDGVFGEFTFDGDDKPFCVVLTHAFPAGGAWLPIVMPRQVYTCVRGVHTIIGSQPFETFEITGVPGHGGLLFHRGNYNDDSKGCILLGEEIVAYDSDFDEMITHSKQTFEAFMYRMTGVQTFQLQVD